jgi:hypothetical protein
MLLYYKEKAIEMGENVEVPDILKTCELWASTAALEHLSKQLNNQIDIGIATLQSMNEIRH